MLKLGGWGIVLSMIFMIWVSMPQDPHDRFDRACAPVAWTGNLFTSLTIMAWEKYAESMRDSWEKIDYGCEYMVWRLFYEDEYLQYAYEQGLIDENGNPVEQENVE